MSDPVRSKKSLKYSRKMSKVILHKNLQLVPLSTGWVIKFTSLTDLKFHWAYLFRRR